jgi:hypothetical protein
MRGGVGYFGILQGQGGTRQVPPEGSEPRNAGGSLYDCFRADAPVNVGGGAGTVAVLLGGDDPLESAGSEVRAGGVESEDGHRGRL